MTAVHDLTESDDDFIVVEEEEEEEEEVKETVDSSSKEEVQYVYSSDSEADESDAKELAEEGEGDY